MKVYNRRMSRAVLPAGTVYIGRPTPWGNPFREGEDGTRAEVIAKFEEHVRANPTLVAAIKRELRGKNLVCWCAPLPCHGDVLLKIANESPT